MSIILSLHILVVSLYNIRLAFASEYSPRDNLNDLKNEEDKCYPENSAITSLFSFDKLPSENKIFNDNTRKSNTIIRAQTPKSVRKQPKTNFSDLYNMTTCPATLQEQILRKKAKNNQQKYSNYKYKAKLIIADSQKLLKIKKEKLLMKLKRLKFHRKKKRRQRELSMKIDNHLKNYLSTTYFKSEFPAATSLSIKGTLDYLEGFVYYAFRSINKQLIQEALSMYNKLSDYHQNESRILLQKADINFILYYLSQSYSHFEQGLRNLDTIMVNPDVSDHHFKAAAEKTVFFLEENGLLSKAIDVQIRLAEKFPNDIAILNKLGNSFRYANIHSKAKLIFKRVLEINPRDLGAQVLLGNVCYHEIVNRKTIYNEKTSQQLSFNNLNECVALMKNVIETHDQNIRKSYFFYTYGDALRRLGRAEESNMIFQKGVEEGLFLSFWQRNIHFVSSLRSKPFWKLKETKMSHILKEIRRKWQAIRLEALRNFNQRLFTKHPEELRDTGSWSVFKLYEFSKRSTRNCMHAPITCSLIDNVPQITDNVKGIVIFSMMEAGTHIHPHSGPSNCRLRVHLGLDVPETYKNSTVDSKSYSRLRVKNEYVSWKNGKMIVWDDSFDHEVWHYHHLNHRRLILIIDIIHPDLNEYQIASL